jgi:hypothetical protein
MTSPPTLLEWILLGPALAAGFFLPGYAVSRGLASPCRFLTSVLASFLLLQAGVFLCDLTGLPIDLFTIASWLALTALLGWFAAKPAAQTLPPGVFPDARSVPRMVWIITGIVFVSCMLRTVLDPLAGWDNSFRWNHLAVLMRTTASLEYYPPVSSSDFFLYQWCDGIPPLVAISNFWIYSFCSSNSGHLISGRIALELVLIAVISTRISVRLWGPAGATVTLLALACSPLLLHSVTIAQETGLSAVTLLLVCMLVMEHRDNPTLTNAVWLGAAAGACALVRDYNLLFVPVAVGLIKIHGATRRHALATLFTAFLIVCPWLLRNAWKTGNPLFPHDLGGLLPTNHFHREMMNASRLEAELSAEFSHVSRWLPVLLLGLGLPALLSIFAPFKNRSKTTSVSALLLCVVALWVISVPMTTGKLIYSMRVLGAGIPLLCILAGWAGNALTGRKSLIGAYTLAALLAADSARRSWFYPHDPFIAPFPYNWQAWQSQGNPRQDADEKLLWTTLIREAGSMAILSDSTNNFAIGATPRPNIATFFSPQADPITSPNPPANFSTLIDNLLRANVRFVILRDNNWTNGNYLADQPQLKMLYSNPPVIRTYDILVHDIAFLRDEFIRLDIYRPDRLASPAAAP